MANANPLLRRLFAALVLPLVLASPLMAQDVVGDYPWMQPPYLEDPTADVHNVNVQRQAFDRYVELNGYQGGHGIKQFERYLWFWEPRTYPTGDHPDPTAIRDALEDYRERMGYGPGMELPTVDAASAAWEPLGPNRKPGPRRFPRSPAPIGVGRVNVVCFDPFDSLTFYIGTPSGGLWKTTDDAQTWTNLTDNLPVIGVTHMVHHPQDSGRLFIATGDGYGTHTYSIGVLESVDGGQTWTTTGLDWNVSQTRRVNRLAIHPITPDTMLAATSNGMYRTTNGGTSWTRTQSGHFRDVQFKPGDPNTVYASSDEIYYSTDNGVSWTKATGIPTSGIRRIQLAVTPANPNNVYAVASNNSGGLRAVYRSTNSGVSYSQRANSPNILSSDANGGGTGGQGWYDLCILASPRNANQVWVGGVNLWSSSDGMTSWKLESDWTGRGRNAGKAVHADHHYLAWNPWDSTLYNCNDGGLYRTKDWGGTWEYLTEGTEITQLYRFGITQQDPDLVIIGTQDNGSWRRDRGGWSTILGGDGFESVIDPQDTNIWYYSLYYGAFRRSNNGGISATSITSNSTMNGDTGAWEAPFVLHPDPDSSNILYLGLWELYRSDDRGATWTKLTNYGTSGPDKFLEIAVAPSMPDTIYAYRGGQRLERSGDGGQTWTTISSGLPNRTVQDIRIHPEDPNRLWVALSGYADGEKVFASTDGGATWTNASYNLPNLPANCLMWQASAKRLFVGMDVGVYYQDEGDTIWQAYTKGLPNVVITEMDIYLPENKLRVATFGRGVWQIDLPDDTVKCVNVLDTTNLGWAANGYTTARPRFGSLDADPTSGSLLFVYPRTTSAAAANHSGELAFAFSADEGTTWQTNLGPLNPSASINELAHAPQVALLNPQADTADTALRGVFYAPTVSSIGANSGVVNGTFRPAGGALNLAQTTDQPDSLGGQYLTSLAKVVTNRDTAVFLANYQPGAFGGPSIRIQKGTLLQDSLRWVNDTFFQPAPRIVAGVPRLSDLALAFSPDGRYGWVMGLGHLALSYSTARDHLFAYRTLDGGRTWGNVITIDIDTLDALKTTLRRMNDTLMPLAGMDLVVDSLGQPHLVLPVARYTGGSYTVRGDSLAVAHIFWSQSAARWRGEALSEVEGTRANDGPSGWREFYNGYPQAARNASGTKVFFTWVTDTGSSNPFTYTNLHARGYNPELDIYTDRYDFTGCSNSLAGALKYYHLAPTVLENAGGLYRLPIVATLLGNPAASYADTVQHVFLRDIVISGCDFGDRPRLLYTGKDTLCPGETATLRIPPGMQRFEWYNGDTVNDSLVLDSAGTVYANIVTLNGCSTRTAFQRLEWGSVPNLQIYPIPNEPEVCQGQAIRLAVAGGYEAYTWNHGDTLPVVEIDSSGDYYVTVRTKVGCSSNSDTFSFTVNALPNRPTIEEEGDTLLRIQPQPGVRYQWMLAGTPLQGDTNPTLRPRFNAFYQVVAENEFGCRDTSLVYAFTTSTPEGGNRPTRLSLFPNPAQDQVHLLLDMPRQSPLQGRVINAQGQVVTRLRFVPPFRADGYVLETATWAPGVYWVELDAPDGRLSIPLSIAR